MRDSRFDRCLARGCASRNETEPSSSPTTKTGLPDVRVDGMNVVVSGGAYVLSDKRLWKLIMSDRQVFLKFRRKIADMSTKER